MRGISSIILVPFRKVFPISRAKLVSRLFNVVLLLFPPPRVAVRNTIYGPYVNQYTIGESLSSLMPCTESLQVFFSVLFGRNGQFVGRQAELHTLMAEFITNNTGEDCQPVAVFGLRGIGKTQIGIELAYRVLTVSASHSVFWVSATTAKTFKEGFRHIG